MKKIIFHWIIAFLLVFLFSITLVNAVPYDDFESGSISSEKWVIAYGTTTASTDRARQGSYSMKIDQSYVSTKNISFMLNGIGNRTSVHFWHYADEASYTGQWGLENGATNCMGINHVNSNTWWSNNGSGFISSGIASNSGTAQVTQKWLNIRIVVDTISKNIDVWMGNTVNNTNDDMINVFKNISYKQSCTNITAVYFQTESNADVYFDNVTYCDYNKFGINCSLVGGEADTTLPTITNYSNQGSSCTNWNTNPSNACSTSDTTPTLYFNTSENAFCAIGVTDVNYTAMGSLRNCTSGENSIEHACDLIPEDELVYEDSTVYLSCKDASGNMNMTSTSGALKLSITGLESQGRDSIGKGIQNALLSGYTNYTDLQIYARNLANSQVKGTFDRAAKAGSKMWAFNRIGVSDSHVNMFNLTPVLYTLELANKTSSNITLQVEQLINATK